MVAGFLDAHLVSATVFLPLVTGLALFVSSALYRLVTGTLALPALGWRLIALAGSGGTFLFAALGLYWRFDPEATGHQLTERIPWLPEYGIHYFVGVDGISLVLVMLTSFLTPIVLLATWNDVVRSLRKYLFSVLVLETAMLGALVSLSLFQFYFFWELMAVPTFFIIGIFGGPRRIQAATRFLFFALAGSLAMLVASIVVYQLNFEQSGVLNFDLVGPVRGVVGVAASGALPLLETVIPVDGGSGAPWWQTQTWLFLAFALAFGIRLPLMPLHGWLPAAQLEAPTGGSVLVTALLVKIGAYGFLRIGLPLFPIAATELVTVMFVLALTAIVLGALVARVQTDLKRFVAYLCVAQMGLVLLGLFALNLQGVTGAVLQMLNLGLSTAALYILIGFIGIRRHSRELTAFGGLAKPMPVFAALFGIVVMSSVGVPALSGFVGEFLILLGTFGANPWVGALASIALVLVAGALIGTYWRIVFGPLDKPENRGLIDLDLREKVVVLALVLPMLVIGVYPSPLLRRIEPAVSVLLQDRELHRAHSGAVLRQAVGAATETSSLALGARAEESGP